MSLGRHAGELERGWREAGEGRGRTWTSKSNSLPRISGYPLRLNSLPPTLSDGGCSARNRINNELGNALQETRRLSPQASLHSVQPTRRRPDLRTLRMLLNDNAFKAIHPLDSNTLPPNPSTRRTKPSVPPHASSTPSLPQHRPRVVSTPPAPLRREPQDLLDRIDNLAYDVGWLLRVVGRALPEERISGFAARVRDPEGVAGGLEGVGDTGLEAAGVNEEVRVEEVKV